MLLTGCCSRCCFGFCFGCDSGCCRGGASSAERVLLSVLFSVLLDEKWMFLAAAGNPAERKGRGGRTIKHKASSLNPNMILYLIYAGVTLNPRFEFKIILSFCCYCRNELTHCQDLKVRKVKGGEERQLLRYSCCSMLCVCRMALQTTSARLVFHEPSNILKPQYFHSPFCTWVPICFWMLLCF